jgi:release factor glutamine methyltransferase
MRFADVFQRYLPVLSEKMGDIDAARRQIEDIIIHVCGGSKLDLIVNAQNPINQSDDETIIGYIARRLKGEPLAYILGMQYFDGLAFSVNQHTLIPRPDSECLLEMAQEYTHQHQMTPKQILDLGTGSGALLISLLKRFPDSAGVGVDISQGALDVAGQNAQALLDAPTRATFLQSNWFDALPQNSLFDLIIGNPPYIAPTEILDADVINFEPHSALFADDNGLSDYKIIMAGLKHFLTPNGIAIFEIGHSQADDVSALCTAQGWRINIGHDLAGRPRAILIMQ